MSRAAKRSKQNRLEQDIASQASLLEDNISNADLLSLLANAVCSGEDITKRYPTLYQKLLANPSLMQDFIDLLETSAEDAPQNLKGKVTQQFLGKLTGQTSPTAQDS